MRYIFFLEREQKSFHDHLEYVLETNDRLSNIKEKAEKMSVIREYIERYGCKMIILKSKVFFKNFSRKRA